MDVDVIVVLLEKIQRGGPVLADEMATVLGLDPLDAVLALRLHAELLSVEAAFWDRQAVRLAFLSSIRPGVPASVAVSSLSFGERAVYDALGGAE